VTELTRSNHPQVLVSLAHAAVTAESKKVGKKLSPARLEEGAEIVKAVFS
jgi:hypothetical protein